MGAGHRNGRITGPWRTEPLPFSALKQFYSQYNNEQRVAVWAMLGGVPAYLEQLSDQRSIGENVKRHIFRATGMFNTHPENLLHESLRDLQNYVATLLAMGRNCWKSCGIVNIEDRIAVDCLSSSRFCQKNPDFYLRH